MDETSHDLNLLYRVELAVQYVLNNPDRARAYRPYLAYCLLDDPPHLLHSYHDVPHSIGRFLDTLFRAEVMTGKRADEEVEKGLSDLLFSLIDSDSGLAWNDQRLSVSDGTIVVYHDEGEALIHDQREVLFALTGMIEQRGSEQALNLAKNLCQKVWDYTADTGAFPSFALRKGGWADLSAEPGLPYPHPPNNSGRLISALIQYYRVTGDALVSRSRSIVASAFLRSDADVLLTIDSDIWFRPQDAIKLCEEAMTHDLIAALYMTRNIATQPAVMLPEDTDVVFAADSQPVEAPFVSTGFMAAHRRVFEKLSDTLPLCHRDWTDKGADTSFWPFYMPRVIEWGGEVMYGSEDWSLCHQVREAGFDIWLDPSIRLGHMGQVMFTLEDIIRPPRPEAQPLILRRAADGSIQTSTIQEPPAVQAKILTGGIENV